MRSSLVHAAAAFAETAHGAQRRKYTNEPYIVHPAAVAARVATVTSDEEVLAAAWLHDVVEDTRVRLPEIETVFGTRVARLVGAVTNVSIRQDGPRRVRKARDLEHLRHAPPEAQTIKYADLIDNTRSIVAHDPEFAWVYLEEKAAVLGALDCGDPRLRKEAGILLARSLEMLETRCIGSSAGRAPA